MSFKAPYAAIENELDVKRWVWKNRILPRLTPNGECMEWNGAHCRNYGRIEIAFNKVGLIFGTHRIALEVARGELLGSLLALHRCDNPRCNNPAHLFAGTAKDNTQDSVRKGRNYVPTKKGERGPSFGEAHPDAKLSNDKIAEIKRLYRPGRFGCQRLGNLFGVSKTTISRILNGRGWKHLNLPSPSKS